MFYALIRDIQGIEHEKQKQWLFSFAPSHRWITKFFHPLTLRNGYVYKIFQCFAKWFNSSLIQRKLSINQSRKSVLHGLLFASSIKMKTFRGMKCENDSGVCQKTKRHFQTFHDRWGCLLFVLYALLMLLLAGWKESALRLWDVTRDRHKNARSTP